MPSTTATSNRLGRNASTNPAMASAPMAASVPASITLSPAQTQLWQAPASTTPTTIPIDICLFDGVPGSGKTFAACLLALQHARENPGQTALIVAKHWATLRDSSVPQLFALLDQCQLTENVDYYYHRQDRCLQLANGSALYFRGLQSGHPAMAANLLVIEGAEDLSETQFTRLLSRLRHANYPANDTLRCVATLTRWPGEPFSPPAWMLTCWPGLTEAPTSTALAGFRHVQAMAPCAHVGSTYTALLAALAEIKASATQATLTASVLRPNKTSGPDTPTAKKTSTQTLPTATANTGEAADSITCAVLGNRSG
jgi:hypothetical protein